jgi:DNA processing protein
MALDVSPELRATLALQLTPGLGPRRTAALLEHFHSAQRVLQAGVADLCEVEGIGRQTAEETVKSLTETDVDAELARIEAAGVRLLVRSTPGYPAPLAEIYDPPWVLYVRGSLEAADTRAVAVVGSRSCTAYGRRMTERLAGGLARAGWTIVSGLARGIDGIAHRAALAAGGRTLAVLAGGLSRVYPPEHAELARQVEEAGALLSEACMEQEPLAALFPGRNRLISGLSQAVVIVEAADRSGTLITARLAGEQGRIVLAVPGPADQESSAGTNSLIRQGAILCRGVEDVLEELQGLASAGALAGASAPAAPPAAAELALGVPTASAPAPPPQLDPQQQRIWEALAGVIRTLDELAQQLGLPVAQLSAMLLMLEMKKVVRRLPGNRYERA